jgi:hypothetical protein
MIKKEKEQRIGRNMGNLFKSLYENFKDNIHKVEILIDFPLVSGTKQRCLFLTILLNIVL